MHPKSLVSDDSAPMGHNYLGNIMSSLSQNAFLQQGTAAFSAGNFSACANHIRNLARRHFMAVTGRNS